MYPQNGQTRDNAPEGTRQQSHRGYSQNREPQGIPIPRTRVVPRHPITGQSLSAIPLAMGGPNLYMHDRLPPERPIVTFHSISRESNVSSDSLPMSMPSSRSNSPPEHHPPVHLPLRHTLERERARSTTNYRDFASTSPPRLIPDNPRAFLVRPQDQYKTCEYCFRRYSAVDTERHQVRCGDRTQHNAQVQRQQDEGSRPVDPFLYAPMPRPSWLDGTFGRRRDLPNQNGGRPQRSLRPSTAQPPNSRRQTVVFPSDMSITARCNPRWRH